MHLFSDLGSDRFPSPADVLDRVNAPSAPFSVVTASIAADHGGQCIHPILRAVVIDVSLHIAAAKFTCGLDLHLGRSLECPERTWNC